MASLRTARCAVLVWAAASSASSEDPRVLPGGQDGLVSFYADAFHGRRMADGGLYDREALTAAHRLLPFGTRVRVTNLGNGRSVVVAITDRGPVPRSRQLDMSRAAARQIGMLTRGVVLAHLEVLGAELLLPSRWLEQAERRFERGSFPAP
jgi:rare lipoprotein A